MTLSEAMYAISWHKPEKLLILAWLEGTDGMDDEDFRDTLEVFADGAIHHQADRLLIDVREFRHRPSPEILAWRDRVTVDKYNQAGVERLAWIWPGDVASMKPSSEQRTYDERYHSAEHDALSWLLE
jgi:hypothetical protein